MCVCARVCVCTQVRVCGIGLHNDEGWLSGPLGSVSASGAGAWSSGQTVRKGGERGCCNPTRTDWHSFPFLLPLTLLTGISSSCQGPSWWCWDTHLAPGLLYTNGVIQQISDSVHVLQSGCYLSSNLQKLPESPLWPILTRHTQEREFWGLSLHLGKLAHCKWTMLVKSVMAVMAVVAVVTLTSADMYWMNDFCLLDAGLSSSYDYLIKS